MWKSRAQGPGYPPISEAGERAAVLLEGGGTTLLKGLGDSALPCAKRLSVAGFFALLGGFLSRKEVYSEGEMALSGPSDPFFFSNPGITVHNALR